MTKPQEEKKLTFEQALAQLEKIVGDIEQAEVGLEESIDKYEEGMKIIKHCRAILEQAEKRIETINKENISQNESSENSSEQS